MYTHRALFALMGILILVTHAGAEPSSSSSQQSQDEIGWVLFNFPPLIKMSKDSPDINNAVGPMADIQRELVRSLPQYKHRFQVVSFLRAKKLFESGKGYCTIILLRNPEREKYLYFGETIASTIPPGLITLEKNEEMLKPAMTDNVVDLEKLLSNHFTLGVVDGRSFAKEVDQTLEASNKNIYKLVVNEAMGNLFKMVISGRVQGVLAYYLELSEEQARNPAAHDLQFYPLKQEPGILNLPVSCEKTPWGKKTLQNIGKAIKDEAIREKLMALTKQTMMLEPPPRQEKKEPLR